jgi:hypothetical protein
MALHQVMVHNQAHTNRTIKSAQQFNIKLTTKPTQTALSPWLLYSSVQITKRLTNSTPGSSSPNTKGPHIL